MQALSVPPILRRYWATFVGVGACLLCFVAGITYGRAHPLEPATPVSPVANVVAEAPEPPAPSPEPPIEIETRTAPEVSANIPTASAPAPAPTPPAEQARLAIQITSLRDPTLATQHMHNLKQQGLPAFVEPVKIAGSDERYRVLVGPYDSRAEAQMALDTVRRDPRFSSSFVRPY